MMEFKVVRSPDSIVHEVARYKQLLLSVGISEASLMGSFIAGGCLRSLALCEEVKDVDIFCHNDKVIDNIKNEMEYFLYKATTRSNEVGLVGVSPLVSPNALTFSIRGVQFQVIKVKTGQPMEVIGEFDFEMNMNYFEFVSDVPYFQNYEAVMAKTLTINPNCRNKLGTLARLEKFLRRGYTIGSKMSLLQLGTQISQLDPITKFSQMETESKLYFTFEEYEETNFVEKDTESKFVSKYHGSAF